ncbi:MAG: GNAT family N-acetyltransferase [Thermomonas sp.]|uniref:GNAT family N-acetyltransferase n=1 Tax=Thermomonas sp. TaxID=1971895 RepID=UPI0025DF00E9|nr:GNAT family N-acetyltransferase [Thermomonas sp.]MBK6924804.1 GNAT family N-acetyltransferase [Thermomonas sp.]
MEKPPSHNFSIDDQDGEEMLGRISALFEKIGNVKPAEHLRWQYVENCGGGAYSSVAVSESGEDAGIYNLFKVPAKLCGRRVLACQSLDTLTAMKYRGKGLFSLLAKHVNRRCDEEGVAFIYGFPNEKSGPGFFKHLQWRQKGHPPFLLHVNNLGYLLNAVGGPRIRIPAVVPSLMVGLANKVRKKFGSYRCERGLNFLNTSQYDGLWASFARDIPTIIIRDSAYLKWRYVQRPNSNYQFVSVYRGGDLCAIAVFVLREKHGGRIGYVMDVIYKTDQPRAGKLAVGLAILELNSSKADVVLAWSSPAAKTRPAYRSNWFFPLPRRLQPIKLFVGMRFGPAVGECDTDELFLSYADSDTV